MSTPYDPDKVRKIIDTKSGKVTIFHLPSIEKVGLKNPQQMPFSIKVLLENVLRNYDNSRITFEDIRKISNWSSESNKPIEIAYKPGRVILQDFTGVPCLVDLAAMRSAMKRMDGDYRKINPQVPCDLIVDHSLQVDSYGSKDAFKINVAKEFERNKERYTFIKWGQNAFKNFRVVPPATGIIHQVNLEYWAKGVLKEEIDNDVIAYPDSLVGTDSHTTMINGLGIIGWGVGGIEAEAVMLGEPIYMLMPEVVGVKLKGRLKDGITATDLVLTLTEKLRRKSVVGKFVEFFGDSLQQLSLPDRATLANMAPEYGATMGFFPVDNETLHYYRMTGRSSEEVDLIERYMKEQGMFYSPGQEEPRFSDVVELNLADAEPSVAGPRRPQDRIALSDVKDMFYQSLQRPVSQKGFGLDKNELDQSVTMPNQTRQQISHGSVVIASITSCTNTSNPSVVIGAALLAKNAVEKGLNVPSFVKTSFIPGSRVVETYLADAGLLPYLEQLGFHIVGYGCATCIGNSGPLSEEVVKAVDEGNLVVASVLSGNRNFEGRIHPLPKANFLASPPLVIAYALSGRVDIDFSKESLGKDKDGNDIFLTDIWPAESEINQTIDKVITSELFKSQYKDVVGGNEQWSQIPKIESELYEWDETSTYIQEPPFFVDMEKHPCSIEDIKKARVLVMVGDSVTTDHISPAGAIAEDSPAGKYLQEKGVAANEFNSYGSRRGNDRVMTRGTFANIRLRNRLTPEKEGSWTVHFPSNKKMSIYEASVLYKDENIPLMVLAGKEYGTGSSRDWAAKGAALLGVKVVLAESYERIHRSNLVGMGILPLQFRSEDSQGSLGLDGSEIFDFKGLSDELRPRDEIIVTASKTDGIQKEFQVIVRLDTPGEIGYYRNGGILKTVLRKLLKNS